MKKLFLPVIIGLFIAIFSCDDEQIPETEFLTINVHEDYSSATDLWMFASNEKGQIMDVAQFRNGVSFALKTSLEYARIDLTLLQVSVGNVIALETYKNFPAGESILLGFNRVLPPSGKEGRAHLTITNYANTISPLRFSQVPSGPPPFLISFSTPPYKAAIDLAQNPTSVLVSGLKGMLPQYKLVQNIRVNDDVVVDFESFQDYENLIELKGMEGFTYVGVLNDGNSSEGQEILQTHSSINTEALYLGTVSGFSRYFSRVMSYDNNCHCEYKKVGAPVTSFAFPQYTTTRKDNSFETFTVEIDGSHDYKEVYWSGGNFINWRVLADNGNSLGLEIAIPPQIANLYPTLKIKDLENWRVNFFRSNGTFTYSDFLGVVFKHQMKQEYEQYTLAAE